MVRGVLSEVLTINVIYVITGPSLQLWRREMLNA